MSGGITATTIAAYAAAAGAVIGVATSVYSADQARKQGNTAADLAERTAKDDAAFAASEAQVQARTIRKAADRQRGEARAALAGSGVVVGEGTAEQIDSGIKADSEQDALLAIYDGSNRARSITQAGNLSASQSRNAGRAGEIGGYASALQSGASALKGWNTSGKK